MSGRVRQITFLRHGLTRPQAEGRYCGHLDPPLSRAGREQVRRLRRRQAWPATVFCSDLRRGVETVALLLPGTDVRIRREWREIAFGDWEGMTWKETGCADPGVVLAADFCFPRGETLEQLRQRVRRGLDEVMRAGEEDVLVIAHQGSIAAAVTLLREEPAQSVWRYRLACASAGVMEWGQGGWRLSGDWQIGDEGVA